MIHGLKTNLVAFEPEHGWFILKWKSDESYKYFFRNIPQVLNLQQASSFPQLFDMNVLLITENVTNKVIGIATWDNIRLLARSCKMGFIIDKEFQGQGYTKDAFMHFVWYLIGKLGFHKVIADVAQAEKETISKVIWGGFKQEAVISEGFFMDGDYHDEIRFRAFDRDFVKRFEIYKKGEVQWVANQVEKVSPIKKS